MSKSVDRVLVVVPTYNERENIPGALARLREQFPGLTARGFQLLGTIRRLWRPLGPAADRIDRAVQGALPVLENWCRYVVLRLPKG